MENDFYRFISAMGKASMADRRKNGELMHLAPLGWRNARDEFSRSAMEKDPEVWPLV